jgi:hypothetical protein
MGEAGLKKDALYFIRPDTYVALAQREQDPAAIDVFLQKTRVHF